MAESSITRTRTAVATRERAESLFWISTLRVVAALAVVFLHTAHFYVMSRTDVGAADWWTGNLFDSAVRWCVPIFVMVSGALLLDPRREEDMFTFARKRAARILAPLVFWTAVYLLVRVELEGTSPDEIRRLLLEGIPYYHLWYLYMIPGLYLITPFLRTYIRHSGSRERWILTFFLLLLAGINTYISVFHRPDTQSVFTLFVPYTAYYLAGYQLRTLSFEGSPMRLLGAEFAGCIALTALGTAMLQINYGMASSKGLYFYDYFSYPVMASAIALFVLMRFALRDGSALPPFLQRAIKIIEPATLGIYLVHALLLTIIQRLGGMEPSRLSPALGIPAVALTAFAGAFAITWLMLRVPLLRRTVS